jgi:4-methylaminobutanoate oxidase (formaldehyde-forming)
VAFQGNQRYLRDRTVESLGMLYAMHWPFRQPETARPARRSPMHDRLADRRACFGVVAGYERPNWFAPSGIEPRYSYSYGRQNWFPYAAEEHAAVREAVGLFDLSSFAKFLVQGKDAEAILQRICANDVGRPPGRAVYTAMLNEQGGIECDLTVTRLAGDRYLVVTGAATATHDLDWMGRQVPAEARVTLTDVSAAYAVLGVMGPRSRELLAAVSDADLSNAAHPYGAAREIAVGYAPVWALRITYVGELGWELYVPADFATGVFDLLVEHGTAHGLRLAGYHALDSLRCEKGYRSWGHDLTAHDTPLQAGLDFAVAFAKAVPFLGREALLSQRAAPLTRRLVVFTLEDEEPLLFGEEPVFQNGRLVGRITSAAYGHTLGRTVALGWVTSPGGIDPAAIESGTYEIEGAGERFSARAHLKPPYDPTGARIRG